MPLNLSSNSDESQLRIAAMRDKMDINHERLSIAEQNALVQQSVAIEGIALRRAQQARVYRQNMAAAAAIEHLSTLDTTSPNFLKARAGVLTRYPDALPSTALQNFLQDQDKEHQAVQVGIKARAAATFSGQANDIWNKVYGSTNNIELANKMAESEQMNVDRAQKLATNPLLDAATKSQIFDPSTGRFNTDPALLNKGEVDAQSKAAATKQSQDASSHINAINTALKTVIANGAGTGFSPEKIAALSPGDKAAYDTRYNLEQALKSASYTVANPSAPAAAPASASATASAPAAPAPTADTSVDDEIQRLLGGGGH